jgi:hypothetical protein
MRLRRRRSWVGMGLWTAVMEQLRSHVPRRSLWPRGGEHRSQCQQQRDGEFQLHREQPFCGVNRTRRLHSRIQISAKRRKLVHRSGIQTTQPGEDENSIRPRRVPVTLFFRPGISQIPPALAAAFACSPPTTKTRHFDRSGSQSHREPRSGETRFSTSTLTQPKSEPIESSSNNRSNPQHPHQKRILVHGRL